MRKFNKLWLSLALILGFSVQLTAQVMPQISDGTNTYWYYLKNNGDLGRVGKVISFKDSYYRGVDAWNNKSIWIKFKVLQGNADDTYYIVTEDGKYLKRNVENKNNNENVFGTESEKSNWKFVALNNEGSAYYNNTNAFRIISHDAPATPQRFQMKVSGAGYVLRSDYEKDEPGNSWNFIPVDEPFFETSDGGTTTWYRIKNLDMSADARKDAYLNPKSDNTMYLSKTEKSSWKFVEASAGKHYIVNENGKYISRTSIGTVVDAASADCEFEIYPTFGIKSPRIDALFGYDFANATPTTVLHALNTGNTFSNNTNHDFASKWMLISVADVMSETITAAENLLANTEEGSNPGQFSADQRTALQTAINTAKGIGSPTNADVIELETAIQTYQSSVEKPKLSADGVNIWYNIQGMRPANTYLTSTGTAATDRLESLVEDATNRDRQLWKFVQNGTGIAMVNKATNYYLNANITSGNNVNTVATMPTNQLRFIPSDDGYDGKIVRFWIENIETSTPAFRLHAGIPNVMNWTNNAYDHSSWTIEYEKTTSDSPVFTGEGNWSNPANWQNNATPESANSEVIINGTGGALLDVDATVKKVTIYGNKSLTVNADKTLAIGGELDNNAEGSLLTVNGTLQFNANAWVRKTPTYGANSTLKYNTGAWYDINTEWAANTSTGTGIPYNVVVGDVVSGSGASLATSTEFRQLNGNLTIATGAKFALSSNEGGDLKIKGNLTNNGTFYPNNCAVFFNGTTVQTVTTAAETTYPWIIINENAKVSVANGNTWNITNLTVDNGATLVGDVNATAATVEQAAEEKRTYYIGSPVSGTDVGSVNIGNYITFTESTDTWSAAAAFSGLAPDFGKGYGVQVAAGGTHGTPATISFTGTLNNSPAAQTVGMTIGKNQFNFLGNPYPSYLSSATVLAGGDVEQSLWFYTRTATTPEVKYQFVTYNPASGGTVIPETEGIDGNVAPMQGFWVKANTASNFTFSNAMRSHKVGSAAFRAPQASERQELRLALSNGMVSDEAVMLFSENANSDWNSSKLMNSGLNIYTLKNGEELALNSRTAIEYDVETAVGVKAASGVYTFSASKFENFGAEKAFLLDKATGVSTDLSIGDYTVNFAEAYEGTDRFALVFPRSGVISGLEGAEAAGFFAFANNNRITVSSDAQAGMIYVFSSVGQQVAAEAISGTLTTVSTALPAGVYMVKVNNLTTKVVVK